MEEEATTAENTIDCEDVDTSVTMNSDDVMESSLISSVTELEHAYCGQLNAQTSTPVVVQLCQPSVPYTVTQSTEPDAGIVHVDQLSDSVHPASQINTVLSSDVNSSAVGTMTVTPVTTSLIDLAGLISDVVQPTGTQQYSPAPVMTDTQQYSPATVTSTPQHSRLVVTRVVNTGLQHIMLPVSRKHTAQVTVSHVTPVTASAVGSQAVYQFIQPQQTVLTNQQHVQAQYTVSANQALLQPQHTVSANQVHLQIASANQLHLQPQHTVLANQAHLQAQHTTSAGQQRLQAQHTASTNQQRVQSQHTASTNQQRVQPQHTASTNQRRVQPQHTASTNQKHVQPQRTSLANQQRAQSVTVPRNVKITPAKQPVSVVNLRGQERLSAMSVSDEMMSEMLTTTEHLTAAAVPDWVQYNTCLLYTSPSPRDS